MDASIEIHKGFNGNVKVDIQNPNNSVSIPDVEDMQVWSGSAIQALSTSRVFENSLLVVIRVVDSIESAELNQAYRDKVGPTNVLSFPNEIPDFMLEIDELSEQNSHLGDLVICESLVEKEAMEQEKSLVSHWAHLVIHGVLHLQGFDHIDDDEALEMEALEIKILEQLGFENPYNYQRK